MYAFNDPTYVIRFTKDEVDKLLKYLSGTTHVDPTVEEFGTELLDLLNSVLEEDQNG